jgi:hypothetical protein
VVVCYSGVNDSETNDIDLSPQEDKKNDMQISFR